MTGLVEASTFERVAPGEHRGTIDAGWAQGRGAYGGLVTAMLVRALEAEAPRGQSVTTITTAFTAPATEGPASIHVESVRAGRNVSTFRASLVREGATLATALATLARPREGALEHHARPMPDVPGPAAVADGPSEHYIPPFARRFSFRQTHGPRPFSGGVEARVAGWCRLHEAGVPFDAALVSAILDAWPPAAVALSPAWCPVASVELTYHFFVPLPPLAGDAWVFYDAAAGHVAGGLADEHATLWTAEGRPIATSRQLIALFPPEPK
ncbi:MAG: thioesterase family protein [Sandaracinus sp.]